MADIDAAEAAHDGIAHAPGLVREKRQRQQELQRRPLHICEQRAEVAAQADAAARRQDREGHRQQRRDRQGSQHQQGADQRRRQRQQPAQAEAGQGERREQRTAQVVEHLAAADQRHRPAARPATDDPRQQLPVAARPAVQALDHHVETRRRIFHHLDIRGQPGAGENTLEQVVAEQLVLPYPAGERRFEGVDVVDALAGVGAFAEQVLVDIRDRRRIRVHAARSGEHALVEGAFAAQRQGRGHPWLEDCVAAHHAPLRAVEVRAVQRVGHLADQPQRRLARQAGVGVEGDHVAHVARHLRFLPGDGDETGVGRAAQQAVQFMQLAALALPAHPALLAGIEQAAPMQQEEARAAGAVAMPLVEAGDGSGGGFQQRPVAVQFRLGGVDAIGEQGVADIAANAGEVMDFQLFDLLQQVGLAGQQGRHRDQGAQPGWHAVHELQAGQGDRPETPGDRTIDQRGGHLGGGQRRAEQEQHQPGRRHVRRPQGPDRQPQQQCGIGEDAADIAADAHAHVEAAEAQPQRHAEADEPLQRRTPFGDQVIAGIADALSIRRVQPFHGGLAGRFQRQFGDIQFGQVRAARQLLDGAAVEVAGGKVHGGEGAAGAQVLVDQADAFEQLGPVDIGDQPHAGDDVAHGDVGRALALLGVLHHGFGRYALGAQAFVEPAECGGDPRVLVAQALGELGGEEFRQRLARSRGDIGIQRHTRAAGGEQAVGECIGIGAGLPRAVDLLGQPAQVLDEDDAQGDRDSPQLADGQGLHTLIGGDEVPQHVGIEVAVGVGDEGPGQAEDARVAGERPLGQLRQLAVITGRQVLTDFADLLFDDVIVVQQPFGGGHYAATALQFGGARPVGRQQYLGVVPQACVQRQHIRRRGRDPLGESQALGMLLEPLDAEQLLPHRRGAVPGRRWRTAA
ncbi:hypothetical protein D3C76_523680 [compost metagenome]